MELGPDWLAIWSKRAGEECDDGDTLNVRTGKLEPEIVSITSTNADDAERMKGVGSSLAGNTLSSLASAF
jgi:hypothetical protein